MRAAVALGLLASLIAGCGGGDGAPAVSSDGCEAVDAPEPRKAESREAPADPLDVGASYALVFETSCGAFAVALDQELAPDTAASLVALAGDGYFDDTIFHRVVPGFVVQGGDPTQTGAGGPGYSTADVPPSDARYTRATVAMAKTGVDPPGTAGSQFFVVTADDAGLPPEYAVVGEVVDGMDTVDRIEALGIGDGPPSQPVVVERVSVRRS